MMTEVDLGMLGELIAENKGEDKGEVMTGGLRVAAVTGRGGSNECEEYSVGTP